MRLYGGVFESDLFLNKLQVLEQQINDSNFWQNNKAASILKEYNKLKEQYNTFQSTITLFKDVEEIYNLAKEENNSELIQECFNELTKIQKTAKELETISLLFKEYDIDNCFLEVHAGAGGTESNDWADMLLTMYIKWAEKHKFTIELVDNSPGEEVGIKSAVIKISGEYAYGLLKTEIGVHRLVRISPFDSNKKRHTSFAAISVYREIGESNISILDKDLKIGTFRASGAGGQHVNKTDSAVRITHLPSGIVVQSQSDRSQIKNRALALKLLQAKLSKLQEEEQAANKKEEYATKSDIGWGYRVRSYVLHPYRLVKDLRSNIEHTNPDEVLNGDLDNFIKAVLIKESMQNI